MLDLDALVKKSVEWFKSLSPEEQQAHLVKQRESWVRGEMGLDRPCGDPMDMKAVSHYEKKTRLHLPYKSLQAEHVYSGERFEAKRQGAKP